VAGFKNAITLVGISRMLLKCVRIIEIRTVAKHKCFTFVWNACAKGEIRNFLGDTLKVDNCIFAVFVETPYSN
jgi:hypothetical protein